ncbi:MAG: thiamine diphosphokinase [Spirochaetales bacterium]|nr:thiamine diphosphokinase [Spirochaetales bacterium]
MTNIKKRAVIVGGGEISLYERVRSFFCDSDYFVFCDGGLHHKEGLGVEPDLIIGDFDSYPRKEYGVETIVLPEEKDDTDSLSGVKAAMERGFEDFLLVGMTGRRMDHTLCNIYLLDYIERNGGKALLVDDWSEMEIVEKEEVLVPDTYAYFSLIAWKGKCQGVYIDNALYPLCDALIESHYQYGISNEPLEGGSKIRVEKGSALLIKDWKKEK